MAAALLMCALLGLAMQAPALAQSRDGSSRRTQPYVIAHRGASGFLPEHTALSYKRAIANGADFIECDMVLTRDLKVVCRHEPWLEGTTNAGTLFPERRTTYNVDGTNVTNIFTVDLTLEEIRSIGAIQPNPLRDASWNLRTGLVTLQEYLDIALSAGRPVGVYPEFKHPTWHNALAIVKEAGTSFEKIVLDILKEYGYEGPVNSAKWNKQPIFLQSFEASNLKRLAPMTCLPLVMLTGSRAAEVSDAALREYATFAQGFGPSKDALLKWDAAEGRWVSSGVLENAHKYGLQVHPYTVRNEPVYVPRYLNKDVAAELDVLYRVVGVDGLFTDHPATAVGYLRHQALQDDGGAKWDLSVINAAGKCSSNQSGGRRMLLQ